ncbi:hypothetical protein AXG93_1193s1110 [Marchantia polymorpha subsp. ruderalis]|uniref:Uncharacterized protein n=1 Tax=Marchantia polymorpha subsp. ruderalis TaxID=1480154 RepID=A0A176WLT3_MARPO|nr:hypothetical protein AXG93_1193s1110 [Marchantia polymorpha subsp. ruderalis]
MLAVEASAGSHLRCFTVGQKKNRSHLIKGEDIAAFDTLIAFLAAVAKLVDWGSVDSEWIRIGQGLRSRLRDGKSMMPKLNTLTAEEKS